MDFLSFSSLSFSYSALFWAQCHWDPFAEWPGPLLYVKDRMDILMVYIYIIYVIYHIWQEVFALILSLGLPAEKQWGTMCKVLFRLAAHHSATGTIWPTFLYCFFSVSTFLPLDICLCRSQDYELRGLKLLNCVHSPLELMLSDSLAAVKSQIALLIHVWNKNVNI